MPIYDIFSKRQKRLRGELPDVYQYDIIPQELRVQVVHIWEAALGQLRLNSWGALTPINTVEAYENIHKYLCYRYGKFSLSEQQNSAYESVFDFFLHAKDTENVIDVIEVSFNYIDEHVRGNRSKFPDRKITPDAAIAALNNRFQEHGVGYQYESGQINRIDSKVIHSEVVKPALSMLSDPMYEGANAYFLSAHDHYRAKRYEDCMNDCLKAFESCIIAICEARDWDYDNRNTIKPLIDIIFDNKLIPDFMESHFMGLRKATDVRKGLRSALESGVPTLRNNRSGHARKSKEVPVPEYIAAYTLHLTASNILFLAKADEELK